MVAVGKLPYATLAYVGLAAPGPIRAASDDCKNSLLWRDPHEVTQPSVRGPWPDPAVAPGVWSGSGRAGDTTRVSLDSADNQGNDTSFSPAISADRRYLAFESSADNLVAGDTNGARDVFVRDRQTGITTRVSLDSADNQGNDTSFSPAISADGRYLAFRSFADNLVAGDTNGARDVFVRELLGAGGGSATPIPTLGQWGLITLGLMLGGLGAFAGRQRGPA